MLNKIKFVKIIHKFLDSYSIIYKSYLLLKTKNDFSRNLKLQCLSNFLLNYYEYY